MNLSISNIAWGVKDDAELYSFLTAQNFQGIEIAPTRIFPVRPYDNLLDAAKFARQVDQRYGLRISSLQSIWYGRQENIFDSKESYDSLLRYSKQAVLFAEAMGCHNLVFGCPKSRNIPVGMEKDEAIKIAKSFFLEIGEFAKEHHSVWALEANSVIYHTNFINTTSEAIELVKMINHEGCKLNLDLGTVIYNSNLLYSQSDKDETVKLNEIKRVLQKAIPLANHIHISEPWLKPIRKRKLHDLLFEMCIQLGYAHYISVEMGNNGSVEDVKKVIRYIRNKLVVNGWIEK